MTDVNTVNGTAPREIRVHFGDRDDDTMPVSWASDMLTRLKLQYPHVFARLLQQAVGINIAPRGRR